MRRPLHRRALLVRAAVLLALAPPAAAAQRAGGQLIPDGTRVRLATTAGTEIGQLVALRADSVAIARGADTLRLATRDVARLERTLGLRTRKLDDGVAGLLLGALVGAVAALVIVPDECDDWCIVDPRAVAAVASGAAGGLVGMGIGIASGRRPREVWEPVRLPGRGR